MKITRVDLETVTMRLAPPYRIAYELIDSATNVFISLYTDGPHVGRGCAAPAPLVTGETVEATEATLRDYAEPRLHGADPGLRSRVLADLRELMRGHPSALSAVDMALHDLVAKAAGLPLYEMLGGYRRSVPTSVTLGILPLDETLEQAGEYIARGFRSLKLKGGRNVERDIERVLQVREAIGPLVGLRFDANQGYTVREAIHFVAQTRGADLELLEQPTPSEQLENLGRVTTGTSIPVMADESLLTLRDAFKLATSGFVDMVNIKLMKVGGLHEAFSIAAVARSAGLDVMVGCMDEAALGISAGLHFALTSSVVRFVDLDGHLDLVDDPTAGVVRLEDGVLYPSERPGLGL